MPIPERNPQHEDLIAAAGWLIATHHDGEVKLDTSKMAGRALRVSMRWAEEGETVYLVIKTETPTRAEGW